MTVSFAQLRKDRGSYDKGRKRSGDRLTPDTNMYRPIIAIDGEGITDRNGDHRYVMLAASDGSYVQSERLATVECFEFLLALPKKHLLVGFSINYDICKWLQDLPRDALQRLWQQGKCWWNNYRIRYAPGKYITIHHVDGKKKRAVQIYDVFGYYQHSFIASLEEWKVGTAEQVKRISEMKASRGTFSDESMEEMLAYCLEECRLLVELATKLRDALIEGEIPMRQWYGAGAIASAIMEKEGVKQHVVRQPPELFSMPILSAYFGGRFELYESGFHRNVYLYDIRSAYPFVASTLPCQTHLVYRDRRGYVSSEWALYDVQWKLDDATSWPPFPFRQSNTRQILYPFAGRGWYHSSEVRSALQMFGEYLRITRSIVIESKCPVDCPGTPFRFIPGYYAYRNLLKSRGSQAQLTIKLGLNSLYGKTAQGVGYGDKKPPFQSYLYAGMITAGTRAMLLDAIRQSPENIIWTATDGIASKVPLDLPISDELGGWDAYKADWVFCVQPGVYQVCKGGVVETRSRGFGKQETNFDAIRAAYDADPIWGEFRYRTTRFVGLGGALMRKDFWRYFGKWVEMERSVKFMPSKRYPVDIRDLTIDNALQVVGVPPIRSTPPGPPEGQEYSAPYEPRTSWTDQWEQGDAYELLVDSEQP